MKTAKLGSISWGTLRDFDLVISGIEALRELENPNVDNIIEDVPCGALEDEDHEFWDSEDAVFLWEDIFDALSNHAPEYAYFGSHKGDGSDFGFWIDWEAIEDAIHDGDITKIDAANKRPVTGYVLEVNDHGNAALYCNNVLVWDIV